MTARAQRRNARRTWDDGSGCPQRPLHPHQPGCRGWLWGGTRTRPVVYRCDDCRTFGDNEDAAEHVQHCGACLMVIATEDREIEGPTRRTAPTVSVGSYGIPAGNWQMWQEFVREHLEGACNFPVMVRALPYGHGQVRDQITDADRDQSHVIRDALDALYDLFTKMK